MARVACMASENIYMYICILTVFLQLTYEMNEELQDNLRAKMQKNWVGICEKTVGAEGDPSFGEELAALKLIGTNVYHTPQPHDVVVVTPDD